LDFICLGRRRLGLRRRSRICPPSSHGALIAGHPLTSAQ
jgi:hypothetical protein